ncbi:helix-turn-helix domain-containing protein, partial [Streptomyces sp. NPDC093094]|uniref:helix-turn-helix domain-containing protein n=1 Tax=Streptomyces sp. NPDC093094 TaxID=3366026 RepID=UPI0037FCF330
MRDGQDGHEPALTELRRRLAGGLAQARLNQTQLARRAQLGRTTVSEALSPRKPVPSAETVAALARALRLPVEELLELQRTAAAEPGTAVSGGPGRPIGQWEPHDLEVHPAGPGRAPSGSDTPEERMLPGYVRREHDRVLAEAVKDAASGRSRIVVLVGTSSTGKTRACWEAVQPLADRGWRLWHPFDPTRAKAALEDLRHVGPRTVVWLNEAQHYLGDRTAGEEIAAAVHHLLISPEHGPVLVLGTLWPEYAKKYTTLPTPGAQDPHSRVRELLAGRTQTVSDVFDDEALAKATALAEGGDRLLAGALTRAGSTGRVTQDLAGAPELLNRYQHAGPAAKALLEAAMDARRLGVGLHLPQPFLTGAAPGYLTDLDYDRLTDDWAEQAYAELAEPVHGRQAPLPRVTPRPPQHPTSLIAAAAEPSSQAVGPLFRLADYLDQHGRSARRHLCPPAAFWHAAHTHLTHPDDLNNLAQAAGRRHRLQWADHLLHLAAAHGSPNALFILAMSREMAGNPRGAENLARQAADHGNTSALFSLAMRREEAGDPGGAETLLRQAADHGNTDALYNLAMRRENAGDPTGAETLARQAADHGNTT